MESTPARVIAPRTPAKEAISSSRVVQEAPNSIGFFFRKRRLNLFIVHSQPKRTSISAT